MKGLKNVAEEDLSIVRVALGGPGGVGKSSVLTSFVFQEFDESYNPTIQENVKAGYHIKGIDKKILIEFIDTAGQEEFNALLPNWIDDSDAFIFVYSVVAKPDDQLEVFKRWLDEIERRQKNKFGCPGFPAVPMIFIGNKTDLLSGESRLTSVEEITEFINENVEFAPLEKAKSLRNIIHFETSAKTGQGIMQAIEAISLQIVAGRVHTRKVFMDKMKPAKSPRKSGLFSSLSSSTDAEDDISTFRNSVKK